MTICLVVQKDTLENGKVKAVLKRIDNRPEEFVLNLQENHCIEYQLLAYVADCPESSLNNITVQYKTNYGKDWYEFDHVALAKIISLFLKHDMPILNIKSISGIFGFSFQMFPVITKEIRVSTLDGKVVEKADRVEKVVEKVEKVEKADRAEKVEKVEKVEKPNKSETTDKSALIAALENLQSELPKKDRKNRKDKK